MTSIKKFITSKLKLKVNEAKSAVAEPRKRKFLGFTLRRKRHIAWQSLKRFKQRVRELTMRRGMSLEEEVRILSVYLRGWGQYYSFCQTPTTLERLDCWIRRRLRCSIWRRWRTGRTKYAQLARLGLPRTQAKTIIAGNLGPWRVSRTPAIHLALPDAYFDSLGLARLAARRTT